MDVAKPIPNQEISAAWGAAVADGLSAAQVAGPGFVRAPSGTSAAPAPLPGPRLAPPRRLPFEAVPRPDADAEHGFAVDVHLGRVFGTLGQAVAFAGTAARHDGWSGMDVASVVPSSAEGWIWALAGDFGFTVGFSSAARRGAVAIACVADWGMRVEQVHVGAIRLPQRRSFAARIGVSASGAEQFEVAVGSIWWSPCLGVCDEVDAWPDYGIGSVSQGVWTLPLSSGPSTNGAEIYCRVELTKSAGDVVPYYWKFGIAPGAPGNGDGVFNVPVAHFLKASGVRYLDLQEAVGDIYLGVGGGRGVDYSMESGEDLLTGATLTRGSGGTYSIETEKSERFYLVKPETPPMGRLATAVFSFLAGAALAAPAPVRLAADVSEARAAQATAYRGETLDVEFALLDRGRPLATPAQSACTMYWQTNGMDSAWWSAPASVTTSGVIRAAWSPTNDVGAASYRVFFAVDAGGRNYRANMTLRMVGSPGAAPNALPPPARVLDFAGLDVRNPPWPDYRAGDNIVITNGVISSTGGGGGIAEEHDPVWAAEKGLYATKGEAQSAQDAADSAMRYAQLADGKVGVAMQMADTARAVADYAVEAKADRADLAPLAPKSWVVETIGGTNTWLAVDGDNLSLNTSTNGVTTNTLWQSSASTSSAVSNLQATVALLLARIAALEARPDLTSWGDYAPDGSANPEPSTTLLLNRPQTLFGSGFSWASSGGFFALAQTGAVMFDSGAGGELRIGIDTSTNYFGMARGGNVTVGCRAGGIRVADGAAEIDYDYVGGDFPVLWYAASLEDGMGGFQPDDNAVWVDNGDGTATAHAAALGTRGFWYATTTRDLSATFFSKAPARFDGGVVGNPLGEPVKYDSTVTVQSGGHTYRVPAEFVQ